MVLITKDVPPRDYMPIPTRTPILTPDQIWFIGLLIGEVAAILVTYFLLWDAKKHIEQRKDALVFAIAIEMMSLGVGYFIWILLGVYNA